MLGMNAVMIKPLTRFQVVFIRLLLWPSLFVFIVSSFALPFALHELYGRSGLVIGLVSMTGAAALIQIVWWTLMACGPAAIED